MKTIIITGASSGLGLALALEFANPETQLILSGRNIERLENAAELCYKKGANQVVLLVGDLQKSDDLNQITDWISKHVTRVDILINNAGVGYFKNFTELADREIQSMWQVNVEVPFKLIRALINKLDSSSHIVNIGSIAGKLATKKTSGYAASKFALVGLTDALHLELESKTKIHLINPGPMDTNFFKIADETGTYKQSVKRYLLQPEKVAKMVRYAIEQNVYEMNLPWYMGIGARAATIFPKMAFQIMKSALIDRK